MTRCLVSIELPYYNVSVPANQLYLVTEDFHGVPHPTPSSTPHQKLGDFKHPKLNEELRVNHIHVQ
jgi:hypothetical protein